MLILNSDEVRKALPMRDAIQAMKSAYAALSDGRAVVPLRTRLPVPKDVRVAENPTQAVKDADIICTATTSSVPVFADRDLKRGAHVSAVGSYMPEMQEVPVETIQRARVVVDSRSATLAETGDLIKPIQAELITEAHIFAELGGIALGRKAGRQTDEEITYFKSVGVAVQDAMAAQLALKNADKMGIGQIVNW